MSDWYPALKKNKNLFLLLSGALLFRLVLIFFGVHPDILSQANWGVWVYHNGPFGLYNFPSWLYEAPSQPPLANFLYSYSLNLHDSFMGLFSNIGVFIALHHLGAGHLLWYFNFTKWFGAAFYSTTDILLGQILIIKLFAIVADILIASVLYLFFRRHLPEKKSLLLTGLFLFLSFSWYLSGLWGQYDQIGALFFILSLIFLNRRYFTVSLILFFISFQIKPTAVLYVPFYTFYYFYQKPGVKKILLSVLVGVAIFLVATVPFIGSKNILGDGFAVYLKSFPFRRDATIVNHAFNLWSVFPPMSKKIKYTDLIFILGHSLTILLMSGQLFLFLEKATL